MIRQNKKKQNVSNILIEGSVISERPAQKKRHTKPTRFSFDLRVLEAWKGRGDLQLSPCYNSMSKVLRGAESYPESPNEGRKKYRKKQENIAKTKKNQ